MIRSSRRLRACLAIAVALLLGGESVGAARALGAGAWVHCCCGSHLVARACKCLHCPTRLRKGAGLEVGHVAAPSSCVPSGSDEILVVTAVLADPIRLPPRSAHVAAPGRVLTTPPDAPREASRPPP